jgi:hypothetical protein
MQLMNVVSGSFTSPVSLATNRYGNCDAGSSIPGGMHLILHCERHKNDARPQFKKPLSQRFPPNVTHLILLPKRHFRGNINFLIGLGLIRMSLSSSWWQKRWVSKCHKIARNNLNAGPPLFGHFFLLSMALSLDLSFRNNRLHMRQRGSLTSSLLLPQTDGNNNSMNKIDSWLDSWLTRNWLPIGILPALLMPLNASSIDPFCVPS